MVIIFQWNSITFTRNKRCATRAKTFLCIWKGQRKQWTAERRNRVYSFQATSYQFSITYSVFL